MNNVLKLEFLTEREKVDHVIVSGVLFRDRCSLCGGRAISSPLQLYVVDKLMALTFLFFIFPPSEQKDYTLFDVNELCERLVYWLQGQVLRRAAGFFSCKHIYSQRCVNTLNVYRCSRGIFFLYLFPFFCSPCPTHTL